MTRRQASIIRVLAAGLLAAGACVQALPRRIPGSDLSVPERGDRTMARLITARCKGSDTTSTRSDPTSRCGTAEGDSVRSISDPVAPPSQKTP